MVLPFIDMHNHFSLRINCLDGIITGIDISEKLAAFSEAHLSPVRAASPSLIAEHCRRGFITYLYPLYIGYTSMPSGHSIHPWYDQHACFICSAYSLSRQQELSAYTGQPRYQNSGSQSSVGTELLSTPCLCDDIILAAHPPSGFTQTRRRIELMPTSRRSFMHSVALPLDYRTSYRPAPSL